MSPSDVPNVFGLVGAAKSQIVQTPEAFLLPQLVGNIYSQVSVVSTLATNVLVTSLIAYKAWSVLLTLFFIQFNTHC